MKATKNLNIAFGNVETKEVDIAEPSNERYVPKTYMFDVTKCDEIYDLLVADGQVVVLAYNFNKLI